MRPPIDDHEDWSPNHRDRANIDVPSQASHAFPSSLHRRARCWVSNCQLFSRIPTCTWARMHVLALRGYFPLLFYSSSSHFSSSPLVKLIRTLLFESSSAFFRAAARVFPCRLLFLTNVHVWCIFNCGLTNKIVGKNFCSSLIVIIFNYVFYYAYYAYVYYTNICITC